MSLTPAPPSKHSASSDDDRLVCTLTGPVIVQNHAVRPKALAAPAAAMIRAGADKYCSGKALDALPSPSIFYVRSQTEFVGAEIGHAVGRGFILIAVTS